METRKTFYLIEHKSKGSDKWHLCSVDENYITWMGESGRVSKRRNPTLLKTKKDCMIAIKASIKYAKDNGYKWGDEYRIVPVTSDLEN